MKTPKHCAAALLALLTLGTCKNNPPKTKPNVLFILADDFGFHDLSFMGSNFYETPNLDRLAGESTVFTDGYATCQVCSPSRASIMSGKFPARHGITDWIGAPTGEEWRKQNRFNKLLPPDYVYQLDSNYVVLPEALKEAGYTTFFAGKWHLGGKGSWPEDHGFDINRGGWDAGWPRGGYFSPFENPNLEDGPDGENLSMRLARETVRFIKDHQSGQAGKPFLAYLAFYAVHSPIQTSYEKWKKYRDKADSLGIAPTGFEMGKFLPVRQVQDNPVYAGLVEQMDEAIGEVLDILEELGLEENTIVIFTSDNGGVAAGDAFATSNKPLRAGKGYQFEGGIREPYFIKVPWMNHQGNTCSTPVTGTDFYPTILELTGIPLRPEEHLDGLSLVPLLEGGSIPERSLIWHYPHYGNQGGEPSSIIRRGDWKLIHYYEDGRKELYNLAEDLAETLDISMKFPEKVKELDESLFSYLAEVEARFPMADPLYDPVKESKHLEWIKNQRMPALEKQRIDFLRKDFNPGNNW
ncbi:MAG: sulfatase, partial [Bacteroidales bacterium]|nr:sulfatase [Bacteroidales bacterium]